jgi:DNA polymerase-4
VLISQFGANLGCHLHRRARFLHDGEVAPVRTAVSESRERTFDHDLSDPAQLAAALERMAGELCASLAKHNRRGRTIAIKVRLDDFSTVTRASTLQQATCEQQLVARVAVELLRKYGPPRPVRLLGVRVAGFDDLRAAPGDRVSQHEPSADKAGRASQLALPL